WIQRKPAKYRQGPSRHPRRPTYPTLELQLLSLLFGPLPLHLGPFVGCLRLTLKPGALDLQGFLARLPQLLDILILLRRRILVSGVAKCPSSRVLWPPGFVCLGGGRTQRGTLVIAETACLSREPPPALAVLELSPYPADRLIFDRVAREV